MTQIATPDSVIANFNDVQVDSVRGRPMRLQRRGSEFWAEFDDPDFRGASGPRRITRKIVLLTGSHEQQQYWYSLDRHRLISKLPGIYLIAENRWIPKQAAFLHPPDDQAGSDTGAWNDICIACHTTNGKPEFDTPFGTRSVLRQVVESKVAEFGIACEACHGPGDNHVRLNHNPARRYSLHLNDNSDPSVVQPAHLDPQRSSQVCGQCHSVWEFYNSADERRANSVGLPYRPGDELRDTRFIAQPTTNLDSATMKEIVAADPGFVRDSFWSDGMIRVSGREYNGLIESPCFKNAPDAKSTLTCFSCHGMHQQADDHRPVQEWANSKQLLTGMDGNEACLRCHPAFRAKLMEHTKHVAASANLCYNCHMPYTTYGLLRALRSHQVSSPNVAVSISTGRPDACNQCHLDKTLAWTSNYLSQWYGMPEPKLTADEGAISAALLWLLRGDAGQRVLIAWSFGWKPAQQASGVSWMPPMLGQLLNDPYEAVRLLASRSLRGLPGFEELKYDFLSPPNVQEQMVSKTTNLWRSTISSAIRRTDPELLLNPEGDIRFDLLDRLKRARDGRRMFLRE